VDTGFWRGDLKERGRLSASKEGKKQDGTASNEIIWFKLETSSGLLLTR
jgi:hypothetical protein